MPSSIAYEIARLNTEIEQLGAEKAQLEAENDKLRDLLAAKHEQQFAREGFAGGSSLANSDATAES